MKIAIISGASSGIGKEFALQIDKQGTCDEIWLIARREDRLRETASLITTATKLLPLDLENHNSFTTIEKLLQSKNTEILYVVNAAGFGLNGDFSELDRTEQLQMIDLNCRSIVSLCHLVIPYMNIGSHFFNISSIAGASPLGAFAIYGASKSFLTSFSVGLASEISKLGIGMTIVTPGSVDTEFQQRSRGKNGRKKKMFASKSSAQEVVFHAIKDGKSGKLFSVFGMTARLGLLLAKVLTPYQSARLAYTKIYPK